MIRSITPGVQQLSNIESKLGLMNSIYVRCHVDGLGGISETQGPIETGHQLIMPRYLVHIHIRPPISGKQ